MINSVAFVVYPVSNMAVARRFYEEILGLRLESNYQEKWLEYDVAGATFAITTFDMGRIPGGNGGLVAFEVDDLDATLKALQEKGVRVPAEVVTTPVCRFASVTDPDGNELIVHRRNA